MDLEKEDADDDVLGWVVRDEDICWIRTRACREMLKVEVCVMGNKVSMCLFRLVLRSQLKGTKYR